jgi:hypothetical protein
MPKYLLVEVTDTLMRLVDEFYFQSGDRFCSYYFQVPDAWTSQPEAALQQAVLEIMQQIYQDHNARLQAAEPDDPNYIWPTATQARVLTSDEEGAKPWLRALNPAIWEWTPCVVVEENGAYTKVERQAF